MPVAIMDYGPTAHQRNEPYGWCWGLATFLDAHPRCREAFRQLRGMVRKPELTDWFRQQLQADWPDINEEWQLFVMNLDYGYDVGREAILRRPRPLPPEGASATITADRGWQSTGIRWKPAKIRWKRKGVTRSASRAAFGGANRAGSRCTITKAGRWGCCWAPCATTPNR